MAADGRKQRDTDDTGHARNDDRKAGWTRLTWSDRLAILIAVLVIAAVTVPRLPPGICYGDSGDLQTASATLGIAHPPGYAGYVTLGYLITRIPGVDPAYLVSLACLASGIVAIWLGVMVQVRLGVNAWIAAAIGVALADQRWVWVNLLAPEVYAPSLAFFTGSAYLLLKYARLGLRRDLLLAALLFGIAAANRPPVAVALPFFVVAWWLTRRRSAAAWIPAIGGLILPVVYGFGFLWVRDTPTTIYNYIEQYNAETNELPQANAGAQARVRRVIWQAAGAQFHHLFSDDWTDVKSQLGRLGRQLGAGHKPTLAIGVAILVLGGAVTARRSRECLWLLGGLAIQPVIFVCAYRVSEQEADLLPLFWTGAVLLGVAVSALFAGRSSARVVRPAAVGVLALTCTWTVIDAPNRPLVAGSRDAGGFVEAVDMATFPENAVIFTTWEQSPPLRYAKSVLTHRADARIVTAAAPNWSRIIPDYPGRPVFFANARAPRPDGTELRPFRKLWRLDTME